MFYECYDKYGRYLGHTQTQREANELIQRGNTNATTEAYSAWLRAKVYRPNLSFAEFEVEFKNNIQYQLKEVQKQNGKTSTKWVIIILIIVFIIFILTGGN